MVKPKKHAAVPLLERVEAVLRNPAVYELADRIPEQPRETGGRPRHFPPFMWIFFEAMISVFGSARQAEAELSHHVVWDFVRRVVEELFPGDPSKLLPEQPIRRHHYRYARDRYLIQPEILQGLLEGHRQIAAQQARDIGLMDAGGPGSFSHPNPSRIVHSDGKVITPLTKAKPGDVRVDTATGEIKPLRHEKDAGLHFEGTGETAWGTKFVLTAVRREEVHGRIILDIEWVPKPGGEANVAMECFRRLAPELPGAQGVVYDMALRGVHHQQLLHQLGWIPIVRVTAASIEGTQKKRHRREKIAYLTTKRMKVGTGERELQLYVRAGAPGIGTLDDRGRLRFEELRRIKTQRAVNKQGRFRWYNKYAIPSSKETVTLRLDTTDEDRDRGFNRTENLRVVPPSDPDFQPLFRRRNDIESINRGVDDSLYLRRAHSLGHARQLMNLLGYALMVNALAIRRYGTTSAQAA